MKRIMVSHCFHRRNWFRHKRFSCPFKCFKHSFSATRKGRTRSTKQPPWAIGITAPFKRFMVVSVRPFHMSCRRRFTSTRRCWATPAAGRWCWRRSGRWWTWRWRPRCRTTPSTRHPWRSSPSCSQRYGLSRAPVSHLRVTNSSKFGGGFYFNLGCQNSACESARDFSWLEWSLHLLGRRKIWPVLRRFLEAKQVPFVWCLLVWFFWLVGFLFLWFFKLSTVNLSWV